MSGAKTSTVANARRAEWAATAERLTAAGLEWVRGQIAGGGGGSVPAGDFNALAQRVSSLEKGGGGGGGGVTLANFNALVSRVDSLEMAGGNSGGAGGGDGAATIDVDILACVDSVVFIGGMVDGIAGWVDGTNVFSGDFPSRMGSLVTRINEVVAAVVAVTGDVASANEYEDAYGNAVEALDAAAEDLQSRIETMAQHVVKVSGGADAAVSLLNRVMVGSWSDADTDSGAFDVLVSVVAALMAAVAALEAMTEGIIGRIDDLEGRVSALEGAWLDGECDFEGVAITGGWSVDIEVPVVGAVVGSAAFCGAPVLLDNHLVVSGVFVGAAGVATVRLVNMGVDSVSLGAGKWKVSVRNG